MAKTPTVNINLRLPPELHRTLVELAASQDHSLNSEIIALLHKALGIFPAETEKLTATLAELEEKITAEFRQSLTARLTELEARVTGEFRETPEKEVGKK
jgi:hypothetical protein